MIEPAREFCGINGYLKMKFHRAAQAGRLFPVFVLNFTDEGLVL